jgi:glycine cleavage system H protein
MSEIRFHKEHTWVKVSDELAVIGISDFAQHQLGKIIYVELPDEGQEISAGEPFGAVESSKSTSDLLAPVSGVVVESNGELDDKPNLINESPYDQGWITKVKMKDPAELENLMSEGAYQNLVSG